MSGHIIYIKRIVCCVGTERNFQVLLFIVNKYSFIEKTPRDQLTIVSG